MITYADRGYPHRYPEISAHPQMDIRHFKLLSGYLHIRTDIWILYPRIGPLMDVSESAAKYSAQLSHPGIQKIRTYWQSLCRIPKQSIRSLVKFNSFLHIQLNFLLVQEHINWLLSSGTYLHRILEPGFTAKLMMTTMMYVMLNFGGISSTMLIGTALFLFTTFTADLYLVNL
jgi:hypothetical protein